VTGRARAPHAPPEAVDVLVADDSAVMRSMIIRTLRLSGLAIGDLHEAADGKEGLRILAGHSIALALVDINMPALDGMQMLARARRRLGAHAPAVIVVSSDGSHARQVEVAGMGHTFLHKPFTPEQLRDAVRLALETTAHD